MVDATYQLPNTLVTDTLAFRNNVEQYISQETSAEEFKGIRVALGIYEQRKDDTYMVRVRGAAGVFLPHQVKLITDLSKTYGNGILHVTTRQCLQIHSVKIQDTPTILERLLEVGLSSRGGGGNTVRNISACPLAGVCQNEAFDVTPYAFALTEYLIRERRNFNLPRKFKAAFSGCSKDCGMASVTDLGFFAHQRDGVRGFTVNAGGGMGAHSAPGIRIEEFVLAENIFEVAEAVKRVFDKHGDRTNRSKARLRFVVQRLGIDEFKRIYLEELNSVRRDEIQTPVMSIQKQQANICAVPVNLPLGDITADHLSQVVDIASSFGDGAIRTTQQENLQLRINEPQAKDAIAALRGIDDRFVYTQSVSCVACAGASICRLGLCHSRGLTTAIEAEIHDLSLPFDTIIYISGCNNSCGHHPISTVGLYGSALRINERLVPFYNLVAGGRLAEVNSVLARPVGKIPAKAVPAILREFWTSAAENYQAPETLNDLMDRWGIAYLRELAVNYSYMPSYEDAPEYYRDFGCSADFSVPGK